MSGDLRTRVARAIALGLDDTRDLDFWSQDYQDEIYRAAAAVMPIILEAAAVEVESLAREIKGALASHTNPSWSQGYYDAMRMADDRAARIRKDLLR